MVTLGNAHGIQLALGDVTLPDITPRSPLLLAAVWLAVCILCALIYWGLTLFVFRRRHREKSANRGTLFLAFFLVAFAGSNLVLADMAAPHELAYFLPIPGLYLLFFYLFSDGRYAPTWTRWLVLLYGFSQLGPIIPSTPKQTNPQADQFLSHVSGATLAVLQVVGQLGNVLAVTVVVIGIVPQIYFRYRHLCETGARFRVQRQTKVRLGVAIAIGSFLALTASVLLAQPSTQALSPVFLSARTGFYLLATLIPVAAGCTLLRGRLYDRDALANRVLIYGTLTICLILIYIATTGLGFLFPGLLTFPFILLFVILVAPFMAALFRPLRTQIEDRVDRRFFRRRYEAARILGVSSATLHDEVHLDQLSKQVVAVLEKALLPRSVTLWLCAPAGRTVRRSPVANAQLAAPVTTLDELVLHRQASAGTTQPTPTTLVVSPTDPFRTAVLRPSSVVEIGRVMPDSPAAQALRAEGVQLALPLISQSELVGLLAIAPRPDAPAYTMDEGDLLTAFADSAAPVFRVVKQAHEQDVEIHERERVEQELQTARRIQESLLPKVVPTLAGWQLATLYQPAREVGGDFYDFIPLADGRLGLVLGDVTDKGIPAALVMATTRSMLRAVGTQHAFSPGQVLAHVNELLCPDLPDSMFVTCFYAILDPATGQLRYANAGQDLPYVRHTDGEVGELRARGMPLGLMPGMLYEEQETTLLPGDSLLFYSDGLVEAHSPTREMFGFPRLVRLLGEHGDGTPPIVFLLHELADFTGADWEQEDDITLVALQRAEGDRLHMESDASAMPEVLGDDPADESEWRTLDEWTVASAPGNERQAIRRVTEAISGVSLPPRRLEQLQTAVGEATMNAMEHGNRYDPNLPVSIRVRESKTRLSIQITDEGGHFELPEPETPDLEAKLAGLQSPRGWGLFLIEKLVDEVHVSGDETHHTVELVVVLEDGAHD